MNERKIIGGMVAIMVVATIAVTRNTDLIFVASGIAFFGLCLAYVEGCGRL